MNKFHVLNDDMRTDPVEITESMIARALDGLNFFVTGISQGPDMNNVLPLKAYTHVLKALEPKPALTEREVLIAARSEAFRNGCTLTRLARDCDYAADEAFRKAQRIGEQIKAVKA